MASFRVFASLDFAGSSLKELLKLQEKIKELLSLPGLAFAKPGQIHLTLAFFPSLAENELEEKLAAFNSIQQVEKLFLAPEKIVFLPSEARCSVIALGFENNESMLLLQKQVAEKLSYAEERQFKPHATIARLSKQSNMKQFSRVFQNLILPKSLECTLFCLKKSYLAPSGAEHTILACKEFH